ncbi:NAD(P)H-hydrate dehydratase [Desulfobacter latus]|uniref:Sugar kinase n=1 Tax=Desulfobacter latus TaxID=2292 RepID=A0A850T6A1_9BACT|nr:NAD(P)H-hydrate dehydratase [Desulfobacter latus]NWH04872.1 sugar kinase [Desulfobacter latus]
MLLIVGTVPDETFPLTLGPAVLDGADMIVNGIRVPVNRGTPALLAAVLAACQVLGPLPVETALVGDIGTGKGSRNLYEHLSRELPGMATTTLAFHYLQPDVDWHNKVLFAVEGMAKRPVLIADAGFMYAAKMSGQAQSYDLFTPDVGELSFLADETAPHPFYTRGFILHQDKNVPDLIARAHEYQNGARHLLVKGSVDYVVEDGEITGQISKPAAEAMEAMGGTGDTLTGLVCALIESGKLISDACRIAALVNRVAGMYADPTPACQVMDIILQIPKALARVLEDQ